MQVGVHREIIFAHAANDKASDRDQLNLRILQGILDNIADILKSVLEVFQFRIVNRNAVVLGLEPF